MDFFSEIMATKHLKNQTDDERSFIFFQLKVIFTFWKPQLLIVYDEFKLLGIFWWQIWVKSCAPTLHLIDTYL